MSEPTDSPGTVEAPELAAVAARVAFLFREQPTDDLPAEQLQALILAYRQQGATGE